MLPKIDRDQNKQENEMMSNLHKVIIIVIKRIDKK